MGGVLWVGQPRLDMGKLNVPAKHVNIILQPLVQSWMIQTFDDGTCQCDKSYLNILESSSWESSFLENILKTGARLSSEPGV